MTIYLDHAATTPVDPRVFEIMEPYMRGFFGNPSSIHSFGRDAKKAIHTARKQLADSLMCSPDEVVFTSSATEANNLAIKGLVEVNSNKEVHIITSKIEHPSITKVCQTIEARYKNVRIKYLDVDTQCRINPEAIVKAITPTTALISIMMCNNETGIIQPIEAVSMICRDKKVLLHIDAAQAFGKMPLSMKELNCDLLSISAHKIYGPKGAGALIIKKGTRLLPLIHGGAQEKGQRGGTENVGAIAGFGKAAVFAMEEMKSRVDHIRHLENLLLDDIKKQNSQFEINGSLEYRIPGILNLSLRNVIGQDLLITLDLQGIAISTGSACSSGVVELSPTLIAMYGRNDWRTASAVRISIGKNNTEGEMRQAALIITSIIQHMSKHKKKKIN